MVQRPTSWFTVGPFFPPHFVDAGSNDLTIVRGRAARGAPILLVGRVLEEGGAATVNTILEIWQADGAGVFAHAADPRFAEADPGFAGWGRANTDDDAWYRFRTVMPGTYRDPVTGRMRAPHIDVMILASGIMRRLATTVFLCDPATEDPVLDCVTEPPLKERLRARREPALDDDGAPAFRFDIVLRGEGETPFFLD